MSARNKVIVAAILLTGAFLLGFVPQFRNASALRDDLRGREERLHQLEREAKLSRIRDLTSLLHLELSRRNYGLAERHATALFEHVRGLTNDSPPQLRSDLDKLLSQQDTVKASIAKSDPAALTIVEQMLDQLHQRRNP